MCVLNLSCIMQKRIFLDFFFHSGHANFAFLTCFLISVAIFLIQRNSAERNSHSKSLVLASVVNLYPVLLYKTGSFHAVSIGR